MACSGARAATRIAIDGVGRRPPALADHPAGAEPARAADLVAPSPRPRRRRDARRREGPARRRRRAPSPTASAATRAAASAAPAGPAPLQARRSPARAMRAPVARRRGVRRRPLRRFDDAHGARARASPRRCSRRAPHRCTGKARRPRAAKGGLCVPEAAGGRGQARAGRERDAARRAPTPKRPRSARDRPRGANAPAADRRVSADADFEVVVARRRRRASAPLIAGYPTGTSNRRRAARLNERLRPERATRGGERVTKRGAASTLEFSTRRTSGSSGRGGRSYAKRPRRRRAEDFSPPPIAVASLEVRQARRSIGARGRTAASFEAQVRHPRVRAVFDDCGGSPCTEARCMPTPTRALAQIPRLENPLRGARGPSSSHLVRSVAGVGRPCQLGDAPSNSVVERLRLVVFGTAALPGHAFRDELDERALAVRHVAGHRVRPWPPRAEVAHLRDSAADARLAAVLAVLYQAAQPRRGMASCPADLCAQIARAAPLRVAATMSSRSSADGAASHLSCSARATRRARRAQVDGPSCAPRLGRAAAAERAKRCRARAERAAVSPSRSKATASSAPAPKSARGGGCARGDVDGARPAVLGAGRERLLVGFARRVGGAHGAPATSARYGVGGSSARRVGTRRVARHGMTRRGKRRSAARRRGGGLRAPTHGKDDDSPRGELDFSERGRRLGRRHSRSPRTTQRTSERPDKKTTLKTYPRASFALLPVFSPRGDDVARRTRDRAKRGPRVHLHVASVRDGRERRGLEVQGSRALPPDLPRSFRARARPVPLTPVPRTFSHPRVPCGDGTLTVEALAREIERRYAILKPERTDDHSSTAVTLRDARGARLFFEALASATKHGEPRARLSSRGRGNQGLGSGSGARGNYARAPRRNVKRAVSAPYARDDAAFEYVTPSSSDLLANKPPFSSANAFACPVSPRLRRAGQPQSPVPHPVAQHREDDRRRSARRCTPRSSAWTTGVSTAPSARAALAGERRGGRERRRRTSGAEKGGSFFLSQPEGEHNPEVEAGAHPFASFKLCRQHYLRRHSAERPHVCPKCGRAYAVKADMQTHAKRCAASGCDDTRWNFGKNGPLRTRETVSSIKVATRARRRHQARRFPRLG